MFCNVRKCSWLAMFFFLEVLVITSGCLTLLKEKIGLIEDPSCQESKTDYQSCSRLHSNDSFIGLTGIKWVQSQPATPLLREALSSILDAEKTCHAFSYLKSSLKICHVTSSGSGKPGSCSHNVSLNSAKVSSCPEFKEQIDLIQDSSCQESKTDYRSGSRLHSEDSFIGLTGIKWNDSLGTFDVGTWNIHLITASFWRRVLASANSFNRIFVASFLFFYFLSLRKGSRWSESVKFGHLKTLKNCNAETNYSNECWYCY